MMRMFYADAQSYDAYAARAREDATERRRRMLRSLRVRASERRLLPMMLIAAAFATPHTP